MLFEKWNIKQTQPLGEKKPRVKIGLACIPLGWVVYSPYSIRVESWLIIALGRL